MWQVLMVVGRAVRLALARAGRVFRLNLALARKLLAVPRLNLRLLGKVTASQVRFSGPQAAPLVALVAVLIGAVAIIQSASLLAGLAEDMIGTLLVSIVVRELGPLITAVVLVGRSGTAMAAELGSMRLSGELDALKAFRIDPVDFVVLPRVLGMVLAMFSMIVLFDLSGLLGGFLVSWLVRDLSFSLFLGRVVAALANTDLAVSVLKALLFGHAVAVLSCYYGLRVERSPTELPQAVTKAVVSSLVAVFLLDVALAAAFYL